jgi:hypothetical protein
LEGCAPPIFPEKTLGNQGLEEWRDGKMKTEKDIELSEENPYA